MKKGTKILASFILGIFAIGFLAGIVSAAGEWGGSLGDSVNTVIDNFVSTINPIAQYVLGDMTGVGDFSAAQLLYVKVLLLIIVLSIVWLALSKIPFFEETTWAHWLVTIAVSILSVRFLGPNTVATILLPYSTLGVAITAIIPFVVWFMLINVGLQDVRYKSIRRIAWVFFGIIFIGLWVARSSLMDSARGIYGWTALIAFIIAMMDGTISRFFLQLKIEKAGSRTKGELETELLRKINQANTDFTNGILTQAQRDQRIRGYNKTLAHLHA